MGFGALRCGAVLRAESMDGRARRGPRWEARRGDCRRVGAGARPAMGAQTEPNALQVMAGRRFAGRVSREEAPGFQSGVVWARLDARGLGWRRFRQMAFHVGMTQIYQSNDMLPGRLGFFLDRRPFLDSRQHLPPHLSR
jgi:hypothetical protein